LRQGEFTILGFIHSHLSGLARCQMIAAGFHETQESARQFADAIRLA